MSAIHLNTHQLFWCGVTCGQHESIFLHVHYIELLQYYFCQFVKIDNFSICGNSCSTEKRELKIK